MPPIIPVEAVNHLTPQTAIFTKTARRAARPSRPPKTASTIPIPDDMGKSCRRRAATLHFPASGPPLPPPRAAMKARQLPKTIQPQRLSKRPTGGVQTPQMTSPIRFRTISQSFHQRQVNLAFCPAIEGRPVVNISELMQLPQGLIHRHRTANLRERHQVPTAHFGWTFRTLPQPAIQDRQLQADVHGPQSGVFFHPTHEIRYFTKLFHLPILFFSIHIQP